MLTQICEWYIFVCHTVIDDWGLSSVGRASALQAEGRRFDPCSLHQKKLKNFFGKSVAKEIRLT